MTVTLPETRTSVELANKGLISKQLWTRLTNRIVRDENVDMTLAERIMDQAIIDRRQ